VTFYVLILIELSSRRVHVAGVTPSPDGRSGTSDAETTSLDQMTFSWNCGNGQTITGQGLTHAQCEYYWAGIYQVMLSVSDPGGGDIWAGAQPECSMDGSDTAIIEVVP